MRGNLHSRMDKLDAIHPPMLTGSWDRDEHREIIGATLYDADYCLRKIVREPGEHIGAFRRRVMENRGNLDFLDGLDWYLKQMEERSGGGFFNGPIPGSPGGDPIPSSS